MNRAAVIIGVKKASALPELKAALQCARQFEDWARHAGFDTVVTITDEQRPVTAKAIKDAIKALVNSDSVEQLFIYFAGHGVNLQYSEYWLLSDAPEDTQEAVNVAGSVQLAKRSGIPHVILISDACRTAPEGIQAQAIRGSEIFPNQRRGGPHKAVDVFYASLLGEPALEIQDKLASALRYDSLFTDELLAALRGHRTTILSTAADEKKFILRPQPLKRYLMSEVPKLVERKLGAASDHTQMPDADILSDEFAFVQTFDADDIKLPPEPKRTVRSSRRQSARPPTVDPARILVDRALNQPTEDSAALIAERLYQSGTKAQIIALENAAPIQPHANTCGFVLDGAIMVDALAVDHSAVEILERRIALVDLKADTATTVLIALSDGRAVSLPALRNFICALSFADGDLVSVSYEPTSPARRHRYLEQQSELTTLRALVASSVHRGVFRLERPDAPKLTERIRRFKDLDPTLALYAAYSYHRLGSSQWICEMEDILANDLGVTIFDIAMLCDRETKAGPPEVPAVPMIAQGWSLLSAFDAETPLLRELRRYVSSTSLWTVFSKEAVGMLREAHRG